VTGLVDAVRELETFGILDVPSPTVLPRRPPALKVPCRRCGRALLTDVRPFLDENDRAEPYPSVSYQLSPTASITLTSREPHAPRDHFEIRCRCRATYRGQLDQIAAAYVVAFRAGDLETS
jgi:hypothetical protein